MNIRPMAVAGRFYPANAPALHQWLQSTIEINAKPDSAKAPPRALIAPHAGYIYSGETAAKAFAFWKDCQDEIQTVVIMGPAHYVGFHGIATIDHQQVATPFGSLEINNQMREELLEKFSYLQVNNEANAPEHSLEVMFPFVKELLPDTKILPLLNGAVSTEDVSEVLQFLWQQKGVYFVISSDLSHFHPYQEAQALDAKTANWIEQSQWQKLDGNHACGYKGIQGLLAMKAAKNVSIQRIACVNSGDTAGSKDSVVGYGSWAIYEQESEESEHATH